jgi:hypothetical protein
VVPEPDEDFEFGLMNREHDEYQSLYQLHVLPIKKIAGHFRHKRPSAVTKADHRAKEVV